MEHNSITIAGETFRLSYDITTSANLIETQRPGKSISEVLDSARIQDQTLLLIAGLDETREKDVRGKLTASALKSISDKITRLIDEELAGGATLRTLFLPVKRAVGASGIAGMFFEFLDNGDVKVAEGKAFTVTASS